jgi:hypothetical protein
MQELQLKQPVRCGQQCRQQQCGQPEAAAPAIHIVSYTKCTQNCEQESKSAGKIGRPAARVLPLLALVLLVLVVALLA